MLYLLLLMSQDNMHENIELGAGEAYINKNFALGNNTIKLNNGWYPNNLVNYCLQKGYILRSDITYYIQASFNLKAVYFKEFVEYIYTLFPMKDENYERIAKCLINCFIGELNKKYYKHDQGCVTDDYEMACSILFNHKERNKHCKINSLDNLYFIRSHTKDKMDSNKCSIWRHIIVGSIIRLDILHHKVCDKNTQVVGYNTDSIFVRYPIKDIWERLGEEIGDIKSESWKPKNYKLDNEFLKRDEFNYYPLEWKEGIDGKSCLYTGMPGSGKSQIACEKFLKENGNRIFLCFTNKVVDVIKKRLALLSDKNYKYWKDYVKTFDSCFYDATGHNNILKKMSGYDCIYVDEYSMVPSKWIYYLYLIKEKYRTKICMFGDRKQCLPVESSGKCYNYLECYIVKFICECNLIELPYLFKYGRYNEDLYKIIITLDKTGKISSKCKENKLKDFCFNSICKSHKTRIEVNAKMYNEFIKRYPSNQIKNYNGINYVVGMPLICNINNKEFNIWNSQIYIIKGFNNQNILLENEDNNEKRELSLQYITNVLDQEKKMNNFDYAFCVTVYRYQGETITSDYNIYDINSMTREEFYTAISRGKKPENVHFDYIDKYFFKSSIPLQTIEKNHKIKDYDKKYQNGKIYKITCECGEYIGMTWRKLNDRFKEHMESTNLNDTFHNHVKEHESTHFKIDKIKDYPCYSERELKSEETKQIHLEIIKGTKLFNTQDTKNIAEQKNQIIQQCLLTKRKKERFNIIDNEKLKAYRISYRDETGKQKHIKKRYVKCGKEIAYKEIVEEREKLIQAIQHFEMDNEDETIYKTGIKQSVFNKATDDINNIKYSKQILKDEDEDEDN